MDSQLLTFIHSFSYSTSNNDCSFSVPSSTQQHKQLQIRFDGRKAGTTTDTARLVGASHFARPAFAQTFRR